jgi:hypothetical protein
VRVHLRISCGLVPYVMIAASITGKLTPTFVGLGERLTAPIRAPLLFGPRLKLAAPYCWAPSSEKALFLKHPLHLHFSRRVASLGVSSARDASKNTNREVSRLRAYGHREETIHTQVHCDPNGGTIAYGKGV